MPRRKRHTQASNSKNHFISQMSREMHNNLERNRRKMLLSLREARMSDFSFLKSWLLARKPAPRQSMLDEFEQFFTYVFNRSKDGISILDLDLTVLGANSAMEKWYSHVMPIVGKKCYQVYHGRESPCASCPSMISARTGRPESGRRSLRRARGPAGGAGALRLPLFDDNRGCSASSNMSGTSRA